MLRIRLTRKGKKNRAFYRIVVAEARRPIKGRFIEMLGFLDPHSKKITLKTERIKYWLSQGAKPSDTLHNILLQQGIIKGDKINKLKQKKKKKEGAAKEEPAQAGEAKVAEQDKSKEGAVPEKQEAPKEEPKQEEPAKQEKPKAEKEEAAKIEDKSAKAEPEAKN